MICTWSVSQRYIIGGPETRMPSDFMLFLANDDNKTQRCIRLREVWGSIICITVVVVVVEGKSYWLELSGGNLSIQTCIPVRLSHLI